MRIAQIAPLVESIPPRLYGGTERVVSTLTEELVARGHDVTLFASGDSITDANLFPCCERSLRLDDRGRDTVALTTMQLASVFARQDEFDVIHNHVDYFAFPYARHSRTPVLSTTHGRLDLQETRTIYGYFPAAQLASISDAQRRPLPDANWLGTVYNGLNFNDLTLHPQPGKYLAFLGRISPEKRPDRAIEVARALDMPLKIAAKVDPVDREYFEHAIRPHFGHSLIEYVGEIGEAEKDEFLGNAYAYLFPIDWPEPFGLTMIEAMACGTPVVAMNVGSVGEVVADGVTGFVCDTFRSFLDAVPKVGGIDRASCRAHVEANFSAAAMASRYEALYGMLAPVTLTDERLSA